jgi:hypothetical protein
MTAAFIFLRGDLPAIQSILNAPTPNKTQKEVRDIETKTSKSIYSTAKWLRMVISSMLITESARFSIASFTSYSVKYSKTRRSKNFGNCASLMNGN